MQNDEVSELEAEIKDLKRKLALQTTIAQGVDKLRKEALEAIPYVCGLQDRIAELEAEIERLKGVISEFGKGEGETFRAATVAACDERIAAYKHEAREAKKHLGWQLIETAPKDGTRVWLYEPDAGEYYPDGYMQAGYWNASQNDWYIVDQQTGEISRSSATHWAALPTNAPKKE
jgi:hypothetical protein